MSSPKQKRQKIAKPEYESFMKPSRVQPIENHRSLYDIRRIVQLLQHNSPLRNFIDDKHKFVVRGEKVVEVKLNDQLTEKEEQHLNKARFELFDAWHCLERVFGDLEDNRLHPSGWDKIGLRHSGKDGKEGGGIVGLGFEGRVFRKDSSDDEKSSVSTIHEGKSTDK